MPPRWFEKVESKAKKLLSPSAPSPLPSSIASEPASESAARRIPQPTPSLTTSTDTQTSPLPSLQEQLWNQAYDELKANQPKLVEAYEKILSVRLHRNDLSSITYVSTENEIEGARETRCRQMQQLVRDGLDRTQIAASIKRGIDEGLQAVQAVRGIVDKAIKAAPEAAIAWVGVCVGLEILSNPITEARCNRDGIAYVLARMEWYWNLVSLLLDDNKAEQSSAELRDQLEKHVVQLYEKLLSYQMKSVCLYHRNWAAVALKDVLRLDDWAGQLDDIQKAEAVVRTDADQYNTEKSKIYLQKLIDTASTLEMNLQSIHSAIKYQTRQQDKRYQDAKYEKCMQDLHVTDPRKDKKRIQDTKGGLLRDSYRWILDHADFRRFRDDPQSRLLWVKGDPGKGKTMLLCGIINELEKESGCLLSYFFCQATEAQLSNATSVLRGLIYLLILQRPSLISHVRSKHDVTGEKLFQGINIWVSLVEIFTDMLNDPALKDGVLVIDALDECIIDRPQLLDFICQSSSASSSRVKWIISSRNWPEIEEKLDGAKHKVSLHLELNMDRISEAVNTYIEYKMDQLAHDKKYDAETRQSVADYLTSNADGTFLWVALVCQKLALPKARARNASATVREFPPSLNSLYMRMMEYIHDLEGRDSDRCKKILASASLVYRPVNFDELRVLVESAEDLNDNDLEEIIALCGSFLIVRHRIIYFVHQSAKDFLLINASEQILPSGISQQHHVLFLRSLGALSKRLERDIYNLCAPGLTIDQASSPNPDPLASIRYSCVFWVDHLYDSEPQVRMSDKKPQDAETVHEFLRNKYLYWLESLSLLHKMPEGVIAVHKLDALVKTKEARQLTELLQDARRFILHHKRAIELAPLQAYISALVFSPTRSLIRGLFEKEQPNWIPLKPRIEPDWNACVQTLEGHGSGVASVVLSADNQHLASSSSDKTVKIWDAITGACIQTLKGHTGTITSVVFSADGQSLASSSVDKTVKIWDTTGTCVHTLEGHGDTVKSVVFSADSRHLASSSVDKTIKIWDTTGTCIQTLQGHGDQVTSVAFSADSRHLASGSYDSTVKIWDTATGICIKTLRDHSRWVTAVVFSADSQHLASSSYDRTVKIWDAATGTCIRTYKGDNSPVTSVTFSTDGRYLASGSYDRTVKIWDTSKDICIQTLKGHGAALTSVVFSTDSQRLASSSYDGTVKIWDLAIGTDTQSLGGHDNTVTSVVFSTDGKRLASSSYDGTVKIWNPETGSCIKTLEGHSDSVASVMFSTDGKRLISSSSDRTAKVWDAETGICLQTLQGHNNIVTSAIFSIDGQYLASSSGDKTSKVWDIETGICLKTLQGHSDPVMSVLFSPDSRYLASSSCDSVLKIWDTATGECMHTVKGYNGRGWYISAAFSADGQYLASSWGDRTVKIWDIATGACLQTLDVGKLVFHLSFDLTTNSFFSTDIGPLDLDHLALPHANDDQESQITVRGVDHSGWGASIDGEWILKDGIKMLWLPPGYRARNPAVSGSTVAFSCDLGRVLVMRFS